MSDQSMADRVEIEALRGEFTNALMLRDVDRPASQFMRGLVARWRTCRRVAFSRLAFRPMG